MKDDAKLITRYLIETFGKDAAKAFLVRFRGIRWTIPAWNDFADLGREADVLDDFRQKPPGNLQEFYRLEARKYGCHPKTIERTLARALKKAA